MQNDNKRKSLRKELAVIVGLLILIVITFSLLCVYIAGFNRVERVYRAGDECEAFTVSLAPRMGKTDSWIKTVETDSGIITSWHHL